MDNKIATHSIEKYIIKKIPLVKESNTVKDVLAMLEKSSNTFDSVDYIYIINNKNKLTGVFSIQELFNNSKNRPIKEFIKKRIITVSPTTEMETIAHLALKYNLKQIPVVKSKKLLGVISSRQIISTINKSLKENIFNFAGIHKSHLEFENSLEIPLLKVIKDRIPWLIVGLMGAMFMALYIVLFEETLAKYLIIASFVPAIVYMSDALGTQVQTIFVRDLAVLGKKINIKKYFFKQLEVASIMGIIIGSMIFLFILLVWKMPLIAFVIALASFISLLITSCSALFITFLIKKFKFDPALGSGPVATIISDITSIIIYFLVVVWLL
ncbi:MAG: magnesium transporter [archaeon]